MKKLLLLLLIAPVMGYGQDEQLSADGTATDQDGNTFNWINYDTQDWAIEDAKIVAYRDGTPIPKVTDETQWGNLTTGAWCYYDNDSSKGVLYNWYAVNGIHDNDDNTPIKEFAPEGWRVTTENDWTALENYLIANGYNYDNSNTEFKAAKSIASQAGWNSSGGDGAPGNNQSQNNSAGLTLVPTGSRSPKFQHSGKRAEYWTTDDVDNVRGVQRGLNYQFNTIDNATHFKHNGKSVRFVRDAATASTNKYSNAITIYPNPTTSIVNLQGDKQYDIEVYTLQGKKVMALTGNTIDMSHLSSATYIVKALDKVDNEEVSYKVVKN